MPAQWDFQKRPTKETYTHEKTPTNTKRDKQRGKETYCDDRRLNSHSVRFLCTRLDLIMCVFEREVCVREKRVCVREWCVCEWKKVSESENMWYVHVRSVSMCGSVEHMFVYVSFVHLFCIYGSLLIYIGLFGKTYVSNICSTLTFEQKWVRVSGMHTVDMCGMHMFEWVCVVRFHVYTSLLYISFVIWVSFDVYRSLWHFFWVCVVCICSSEYMWYVYVRSVAREDDEIWGGRI